MSQHEGLLVRTGVYAIRNVRNGKLYVGSTSCNFARRWRVHYGALNAGTHVNRHLQRAWTKDGESSFVFEVLESCLPDDCTVREQWWINKLRPDYNIAPLATSTLGIKFSDEARARITAHNRQNMAKPEIIAKLSTATKRNWDDPAKRPAMVEANRRRYNDDPGLRIRLSQAQRAAYKKRRIAAVKARRAKEAKQ